MIVYRLSKEIYANNLSGKGAQIAGGRWSSKGNAALYSAQSIALCVAEIAVHIPLGIIPKDYRLIHIDVPDVEIFEPKRFPKDWNRFPHLDSTQKMGDRFLKENKFLMMKVPSAAVQGEFNYIINPRCTHFKEIEIRKIEKFTFDDRLFVR
ncbi:RES family NAD+ phosphorylase [Epilithonimonas tenax]|uniref:RES family NAD+ phosphorylase n=1 Tax=Epilithonimonas tenax TaxID=191577 RepID=UPI00040F5DEF|nr:RES family NAD+ phosphorylase [Epilithonimonas tenax]